MNRLGGRSNTGEGGEDPARCPVPNGDWRQLRHQAGRARPLRRDDHYLTNADELQIKMAQGASPARAASCPATRSTAESPRPRHTIPGIPLISPPPHHDIYSIEDLAQLIYDLRSLTRRARVSRQTGRETGVGTIAAGVAKAYADDILISGHSGGTGASPLSSIKHAGVPWELGLAETQQVLVMKTCARRVRLRADGGLTTGRDVIIAALLGADELWFGTAPSSPTGCVMARACHLNTCPIGIATQRPDLRGAVRRNARACSSPTSDTLAEEVRAPARALGVSVGSTI